MTEDSESEIVNKVRQARRAASEMLPVEGSVENRTKPLFARADAVPQPLA